MKNLSAFRIILTTGVALAAFPATASAQDAATADAASGDAIVVTGQRQQYRGDVPITEIPQSVQVISGETLSELNITTLDSALELSSGISRQNSFGGLWDSFAVRGFAGDENFPSGFLVNGFNGGRGYGGPRDASNVERIEILKGPNGAVFGRGEPGGTVNIITRKAKLDESSGSFSISAGSFDTYRVEGDYNLVLSDTLAVRVNGAAQEADSFRDTLHSRKRVASPSILFRPSSKTSITYEMEYVDQEIPFDRGILAVNGKLGVMDNSTFLGEPGNGAVKVGVLGHQLQFQHEFARDWVFLAGFGYKDTSFKGFSTQPELAGSRQTLEETGNIVSRQRNFRDNTIDSMVVRAEISGNLYTGSIEHHVLVGADWDRLEVSFFQQRYRPPVYTLGSPITAANNAVDIFDPVYGQLPATTALVTNTFETQKAWGVYFQDQIDLTEKLKLRLSGRYDHFKQSIFNRAANAPLPGNVRKRFSPSAGILYELTDTLSTYVAYGEGFRPNSGTNAALETFEAETSESYEGGLRYVSLDNNIVATLAAFRMKKNNILTADIANPNFSVAAGSARSQGVEFDITAALPSDVNVIASYSLTDAEWTTDALDPAFGLSIKAGDPLINVPKHQANLIVTKSIDLGNAGVVTIGGGVNYSSKRLGETSVDFYLPSYTLVRALVSYEPNESVRLSVDARNLFNQTWYASSYHRYWVMPGTPRSVTVRADFSF